MRSRQRIRLPRIPMAVMTLHQAGETNSLADDDTDSTESEVFMILRGASAGLEPSRLIDLLRRPRLCCSRRDLWTFGPLVCSAAPAALPAYLSQVTHVPDRCARRPPRLGDHLPPDCHLIAT